MIWLALAIVGVFGFAVFFGAPYVPSKKSDLKRAFEELYPLGSSDTLVDIGSGDGVVLRMAAERGAIAVGYEINPILVVVANILSRRYDNVSTRLANFYRAQLPESTTVVYTFGDSRDIKKMAAKVQQTANRIDRPIAFISYAIVVPELTPTNKVGAHYLYQIKPLQSDKA